MYLQIGRWRGHGRTPTSEHWHQTEGRLQFPSDRRCLPEASWPVHVSWPAGRPEKPFYWFQHRILECADCRSPCSPSSIVRPPLAEMPANGTCQSLLDQRSKCDQHLSLWTEKIYFWKRFKKYKWQKQTDLPITWNITCWTHIESTITICILPIFI